MVAFHYISFLKYNKLNLGHPDNNGIMFSTPEFVFFSTNWFGALNMNGFVVS